jgi:hypothetical protein
MGGSPATAQRRAGHPPLSTMIGLEPVFHIETKLDGRVASDSVVRRLAMVRKRDLSSLESL